MADNTFQYITRPSTQGNTITTMPKYRGTKTQAQVYAEIAARLGSTPLTIANVIQTHDQVIIDWTTAAWKIEPLGDGLIGYVIGSGGSSPIGQEPPHTFDEMGIDLRGHFGTAGRDRSRAGFSAEKVGEQNRVTPVFVEVYDSATKTPNHYVANQGLTIILGNRNPKFDPTQTGQWVRFQKSDGTYVTSSSYPYIKGNTIVCVPPTGLTGTVELEITLELNGMLRTGRYSFPLS
jgi:hypothetical protein